MTQGSAHKVEKDTGEKLRTLQLIKDYKRIIQAEIKKKALQDQLWEHRRQEKLQHGKKTNILFLASRPTNWGSLKTVCNAFIADPRCNVKIVAIPEREPQPNLIYNHNIFSDLGAYDYLSNTMNCRVINGYNGTTREWLDLEKLQPDYVFIQTPYNGLRPEQYNSTRISAYAKICYLAYGTMLFSGLIENVAFPKDFFGDVSFHFYESPLHKEHLKAYYASMPQHRQANYILSGYARFEDLRQYAGAESPVWTKPHDNSFRVLWTPRWSTQGNDAHFLDYKDKFLELCDGDQSLDFVFRPHPLTFKEVVASRLMTQPELDNYIDSYNARSNARIDRRPVYLDTFFSSDVLVTDISSILPEYLACGKPIIYCHKTNNFNEIGTKLAKAFYWAYSWDDVVKHLGMLKANEDPLQMKRQEILADVYYMPAQGTGSLVKEHVLRHFFTNTDI